MFENDIKSQDLYPELKLEYPKDLAKALWKERNSFIIDLLYSSKRLMPSDGRNQKTKKNFNQHEVLELMVFRSLSNYKQTSFKFSDQFKIAVRKKVQLTNSAADHVTIASDLISRYIIRNEDYTPHPLEISLMAYYVCSTLKIRFPWDVLTDDFFENYSNTDQKDEFKEILRVVFPYIRILYVLLIIHDEHLECYLKSYTSLKDNLKDFEDLEFQDTLKIDTHLVNFLKERRLIFREFRKAFFEFKKFTSLEKIEAINFPLDNKNYAELFWLNVVNHFDQITKEIGAKYEAKLPRIFKGCEVLALVKTLNPPLEAQDLQAIQDEIKQIEAKTLTTNQSALKLYILPALLGELKLDFASLDKQLFKHYSFFFVSCLLDGTYVPLESSSDQPKDKAKVKTFENEDKALKAKEPKPEAQVIDKKAKPKKKGKAKAIASKDSKADIAPSVLEASEDVMALKVEEPENPEPQFLEPVELSTPLLEIIPDFKPLETETKESPDLGAEISETKVEPENLEPPVAPKEPDLKPVEELPLEPKPTQDLPRSSAYEPEESLGLLERKLLYPNVQEESETLKKPETKGLSKVPVFRELEIKEPPVVSTIQVEEPQADTFSKCYIAQIIKQDTEALYWLSKSIVKDPPCPLWLAEFLHLGLHLVPVNSNLGPRISELAKEASANLDELNDRQALLLGAAILRPSLMLPQMEMATIASFLSTSLSKFACTPFFQRLNQFISQGKAMDSAIFLGQNAEKQWKLHYENMREKTNGFLNRIKNGRLPATVSSIRNDIFSKNGALGHIFQQCLDQDFEDLNTFMNDYPSEMALERLINSNRFYPKTKKISDFPRRKLLEGLREAYNLLGEWKQVSQETESLEPSTNSYLLETYRHLLAEFEAGNEKLQQCPEGLLLANQIALLQECPRTALPLETLDPKTSLELWPLKIPLNLDALGLFPLDKLISVLMANNYQEVDSVAKSLAMHLAEGQLEEAKLFLDAHPAYLDYNLDLNALNLSDLPQGLPANVTLRSFAEACQEHLASSFSKELENVQKLISDYSFKSIIHFQQQSQYNSRIEYIRNTYEKSKYDKAQGLKELKNIALELKKYDEVKHLEVETRIKELLEQKDITPEAKERLETVCREHLRLGMYISAWSDIVDVEEHLSKGKPLRNITKTETQEQNAAHDFYHLLEKDAFKSELEVPIFDEAKRHLRNKPLASEKGRQVDAKDVGIATQLLRWLGFTLDQSEQAKSVYSAGRPNFWRVIQYNMEIAGPIPQWGSRQIRHTIAFGWEVKPEDINQLFTSSHFASDEAVTVFCFTPFDFAARKKLLAFCASRHIAPLVIDTNLVKFLARYDGMARTNVLFSVALAGSSVNPYMPEIAGSVPKEMFFGREKDISAVSAREGPCIIFGGRQLGKSALLQQIYKRQNASVRVLLHSMRPVETSLLDAALQECRKAEIVPLETTANTLAENITNWLNAHPGTRILLLLDECDRALEFDAQRDFADAVQFRDLMQKTERNFKVVFTGLHSVQRFSQYPNNPLYHFGDPLCIGPLSPEAANDLMRKPTSFLGLEFENDQLVQMALNHCNYQPKLIQIFCSELVQALDLRPNRGPFHVINKDTFVKIYESHNLKKKILECFEMTLNLDERYLVIGYTMAINHGRGFSFNELLEELRYYWPAAFGGAVVENGESDVSNTLRSLLHEMEGLGLVISLGGKYRLRTPNIVDLLGGEESIYARLDPYQNKPFSPRGNPDELRLPGLEPFVASQYSQLVEKTNSLLWISGSKALGLEECPKVLRHIAENHKMSLLKLSSPNISEIIKSISSEYDKIESGGLLVWVDFKPFASLAEFMVQADDWLTKQLSSTKFVKIVGLLDPDTLWSFIKAGLAERYSSYQLELQPWTTEGIERFCKEKGIPGINPKQTLEKTGGWSFLVEEVLAHHDSLSTSKFLEDNFCMPSIPAFKALLSKYAPELGSLSFSRDEIDHWLNDVYSQSLEERQELLYILKSLKILREKGANLRLEPLLASCLEASLVKN